MPKSTIWVMVSNSTHARFFEAHDNNQLKEVKSMSHPEGRLRNQDLVTDKSSKMFERTSTTGHGEGTRIEPKTLEFVHFAEDLAKFLTKAQREGKFKKLYISANPSFLGLLRQQLDPQLAPLIAAELNVDLTHLSASDIRQHLPYIL